MCVARRAGLVYILTLLLCSECSLEVIGHGGQLQKCGTGKKIQTMRSGGREREGKVGDELQTQQQY